MKSKTRRGQQTQSSRVQQQSKAGHKVDRTKFEQKNVRITGSK